MQLKGTCYVLCCFRPVKCIYTSASQHSFPHIIIISFLKCQHFSLSDGKAEQSWEGPSAEAPWKGLPKGESLLKKSRVEIPAVHLPYAKLYFWFSEDNFKRIKARTVSLMFETHQTHRECVQLLSYIFSVSKCSTWHNIIMTIVSGVNTSTVTSNETSYAHTWM